jgi:dihydrofolate synthase/folylpolyglutamate synthase
MSAVGFVLFSRHKADYCVLEVGLGGRFDATNVIINPAASLITPVGLDHEAYLGNTIEKIAFEKAGIIKSGSPVIVGLQEDAAREVIEKRATELGCPLAIARQDFDFYEQAGRFVYQDEAGLLDLPLPALIGAHQLANAAIAISACRQVLPDLSGKIFEAAMKTVSWPGRFERLPKGRLNSDLPDLDIWIDGGHNPHAGRALAGELARLQRRDPMPLILIAGMLTTKEPNGFFQAFGEMPERVITLPVNDSDAGFEPQELARIVRSCGMAADARADIETALSDVAAMYPGRSCRILICGSLYLVGEILKKNVTPPL